MQSGGVLKYFYLRKLKHLGWKTQIDLGINVAGPGLHLPHGRVVISPYSKIGKNCRIFSDVTIGVNGYDKKAPRIGDNVVIGSGAKIIGNVFIADNVVIGAGSIVVHDITQQGSVVVGNPAHIINNLEK